MTDNIIKIGTFSGFLETPGMTGWHFGAMENCMYGCYAGPDLDKLKSSILGVETVSPFRVFTSGKVDPVLTQLRWDSCDHSTKDIGVIAWGQSEMMASPLNPELQFTNIKLDNMDNMEKPTKVKTYHTIPGQQIHQQIIELGKESIPYWVRVTDYPHNARAMGQDSYTNEIWSTELADLERWAEQWAGISPVRLEQIDHQETGETYPFY